MCGIVATATVRGRSPIASLPTVLAMRDALRERGPDDAGEWSDGQVHIGHRRLAINTPNDNRQPFVLDGADPVVLAFNGELYDCATLRRELESRGRRIARGSDTELLAHAIAEWGADAVRHIRGMFAFVAWRPATQTLLIARDALGVVPLHYALLGQDVVIASEARAVLAHPSLTVQPDWGSVLHYLNSLRTTMGERTMFEGVRTLLPGERIEFHLDGDRPRMTRSIWWRAPAEDRTIDEATAAAMVRAAIEDSVAAHAVSDVPITSLLSGGIDSTIVAALLRPNVDGLRTFCAGAVPESDDRGDLAVARRMAEALGTSHESVGISREAFLERWPALVGRLGMPLSTPNEVAIHAVAEAIATRAKVTLSGEGADELFAGYGPPLEAAAAWIAGNPGADARVAAEWHTSTFAWVPPSMFEAILTPDALAAAGGASIVSDHLRDAFVSCGDPGSLRTHLDLQRRLNLPSLLQRLNTATMLAGVEGRTPFADLRVAELAARIPMAIHHPTCESPAPGRGGAAVATMTLPRTKRALRAAFADLLPEEAVVRPKASFPLPFERWIADATSALECDSLRAITHPEAIEFVRTRASEHWRLAWPMMNLSLWLRRWWG